MEIRDAMRQRHSVRQYTEQPLNEAAMSALQEEIQACNREGSLHVQLVTEEPRAFDSFMAHYGKFSGVRNYIALIGERRAGLDEACGYYGERLALLAQQLGLNTCWVAMTYKRVPDAFVVRRGEKLVALLALGYGKTQGVAHRNKTPEQVSNVSELTPAWFREGVEVALLAPTAMNQQKFRLSYTDGAVVARAGLGFYTKVDLGIVKYHFEVATGRRI